MKRILLSAALLLSLSTALAGPLGLDMGQSLDALSKQMQLKKEREFVYSTSSTPKPHPDFETYNLIVTPEHGLCKLGAISKTFETSAYGEALKSKFNDIESALTEKYGKGSRMDFLKSGSIWNEPRDWMMGLRKDERVLTSYWKSEGDKQLPDNVQVVMLEAKALSGNSGWISLHYEFTNASACLDSMKKKRGSSL